MARGKGWGKRLLKGVAYAVLAFGVWSVTLVLLLRFIHPPASALMVERRVASWFSPGPYHADHTWVPLEDIAPCMGAAVMASEDQKFPDHFGFDWESIQKAYEHNERSRKVRGASTISQQTAKNLFLWQGRSYVRKGFEVWFTVLLEAEWPKRRILETYLNIVEFGDGVFGVEAASQRYFHKPAKRLRPSEAALLATVLPNPHKYRVDAPSAFVRQRQAWILEQMSQMGGVEVVKDLEK
ncbi:MAG TPA: monofunctional biosynthetic peptidoglycan transglycosylase [Holophagaceae bacterium]|nr:monofunctional biosynthetic peptidoglycan transglycosylase [Holophagaceae bacterium]